MLCCPATVLGIKCFIAQPQCWEFIRWLKLAFANNRCRLTKQECIIQKLVSIEFKILKSFEKFWKIFQKFLKNFSKIAKLLNQNIFKIENWNFYALVLFKNSKIPVLITEFFTGFPCGHIFSRNLGRFAPETQQFRSNFAQRSRTFRSHVASGFIFCECSRVQFSSRDGAKFFGLDLA